MGLDFLRQQNFTGKICLVFRHRGGRVQGKSSETTPNLAMIPLRVLAYRFRSRRARSREATQLFDVAEELGRHGWGDGYNIFPIYAGFDTRC